MFHDRPAISDDIIISNLLTSYFAYWECESPGMRTVVFNVLLIMQSSGSVPRQEENPGGMFTSVGMIFVILALLQEQRTDAGVPTWPPAVTAGGGFLPLEIAMIYVLARFQTFNFDENAVQVPSRPQDSLSIVNRSSLDGYTAVYKGDPVLVSIPAHQLNVTSNVSLLS